MNRTIYPALAAGLILCAAAGGAQATDGHAGAYTLRVADNDVDKRTVVKQRPKGSEVRRTTVERPNGAEVQRRTVERPNGNMMSRTVRERPNGNVNVRVTRKAVTAPRRFRIGRPWIAPRGFVYRRFNLGERVPFALLAATYFLTDYALYGLEPPPPGYVWIREGSDAVLVDRYTGEVIQVEYDAFY
jgi:Ni/Co efflux regulator RcnB